MSEREIERATHNVGTMLARRGYVPVSLASIHGPHGLHGLHGPHGLHGLYERETGCQRGEPREPREPREPSEPREETASAAPAPLPPLPPPRVRALVVRTDKLSANAAREFAASALAHSARVLVILASAGPTAPVRLAITELERGGELTIEAFTLAEMQINILEHELQPEFGVLSDSEIRTLLADHKIKLTQLPRILASDPCARYLGVRRGAVMCITRRPPGANEMRTYRVVT